MMKSPIRICATAVVAILVVGGAACWFLGRAHKTRLPAPQAAKVAARPPPAASAPLPPAATAAPAPPAPQQAQEIAGTEHMYLAHASLRTPEVADPDSATNRQILQTMVGKALGTLPPPAPKVRSNP